MEREKNNEILNAYATVTVHIRTVTVVIVHNFTPDVGFFCSKQVKSVTFSILHNFTHIDRDALSKVFCY